MSYFAASKPISRPSSRHRTIAHDDRDIQANSSGLAALAMNLISLPLRPVRRWLPRMFPLLVCLLCIPVLLFFSGAAGWAVWRNVPVGWKADVFLEYGEAISPFANVNVPPIMANQPYDISLHLVLPATESNYALGNFMITLRLTTPYNESIITIRRPAALVPPRYSLARQLLLGSSPTTKLDIQLLSQFVTGTTEVNARLEVGRSDGWKGLGNGQSRELSVLEATLKGNVRPRGFLAILARYPRLTTFLSTFTFFFISLLVVSGFLFTAIRADSSPPPLSSHRGSGSEDGGDSPDLHPEKTRHSRRHAINREGDSESSSPGDEKPQLEDVPSLSESTVQVSALRNRRSSPTIENLKTGRRVSLVKIEDNATLRSDRTPPPYPKSPYPRLSSVDGNSSSRQQDTPTELASPLDADAESS